MDLAKIQKMGCRDAGGTKKTGYRLAVAAAFWVQIQRIEIETSVRVKTQKPDHDPHRHLSQKPESAEANNGAMEAQH
jgi:hypothetical protein